MNEEQRNRAILAGLESDWRSALETMNEVRQKERRETRAALAALHRQYRRVGWSLLGVLAAGIAVVVIGFAIITAQADDIAGVQADQQASRARSIEDACRERTQNVGGNLFFIQAVAPKLLPLAESVFRIQPSCRAYTEALLANQDPPPTVAGFPISPRK